MNFKSLPQLLDHFKNEAVCVEYYEQIRWNGKPICPHCDSEKPYKTTRGWKCSNNECHKKFTVKVGTIFENSKVPFRIWFAAIFLCTSSKKGMSSLQLHRQLGITQKTAWFLLHRIREMLKNQAPEMLGDGKIVEADESYIGGKEGNRHYGKQRSKDNPDLANDGTPYKKKNMVVGIVERGGKIRLKHVPSASVNNMVPFIEKHVPQGSTVFTDESVIYKNIGNTYTHKTVTHAVKKYVDGEVHTNSIENFWGLLKRGILGIYHQVSEKHLERYLNEFTARYNERDLTENEKFNKFLQDSEGGLLYKNLISE